MSIQSMKALFADTNRQNGEESETFTSRLMPILEQMENVDIADSHPPFFLFFLLPSNTLARNACTKMQLKFIKIKDMVNDVEKIVLFDGEIPDRRVTIWNSISYDKFRKTTDFDENTTRKCIEFMIEYQKDIPSHMLAPEHL